MTAVAASNDGYQLEDDLIVDFAAALRSGEAPLGVAALGFEFDYVGGAADILALDSAGELIAFEGKLTKWRCALHQAYRTRSFVHRAFVVLPALTATVALRYARDFARRRVGLCSFSRTRGIQVMLDAERGFPLQPWITAFAVAELQGAEGCQRTPGSYRLRGRSAGRAA